MKKRKKTKRISKKLMCDQWIKIKNVDFCSFHCIKMEQKALYFGKNGIIKSAFHKNKNPININEVDTKNSIIR